MRLEGKVVLITGASKGIGRTIALGLAEAGANCIVHYNTDAQAKIPEEPMDRVLEKHGD